MRPAALLLLLPLASCVIGDGKHPRPYTLEPEWLVERLRLLAIQAEPPEVAPGEEVRLQALLPDPDGLVGMTVWVACSPDGGSMGCLDALQHLDLDGEDPPSAEDLEEAGVIGVEPFLPPRWTPGPELLHGLEGHDRVRGVQALVHLTALPHDLPADPDDFDYNEVKAGYKRVVVSEDPAPNQNPTVAGFLVDGHPVPPGATVQLDAGQPYEIAVELTEDSVETYLYLNRDGVWEERVEEPYVSWYTSHGELIRSTSLHPWLYTTWIAEDAPGTEGAWWAVVRDRRGGVAWVEQPFAIR